LLFGVLCVILPMKGVKDLEDICNFLPKKEKSGSVEYYNFVYESNFKKLAQPFFQTKYRLFLPFKGHGTLIIKDKKFTLSRGTMFFIFPSQTYEISGSDDFTYLYITFNGSGAKSLLGDFDVNPSRFLFDGVDQLPDFWMKSIRRINQTNATALTESVLLYSLSFIGSQDSSTQEPGRFESIIRYVNGNFGNPTLSVKKVADIYFYSEKYLSSLFKRETGKRFTEYLNELRISKATAMINSGNCSVTDVATRCGFSDPLYFSKVFKKINGQTPSEYIKARLK